MNKIYISQNNIDQILHPTQWATLGLDPNKGCLFLGRVGVGKTTILRALASAHNKVCWGHPRCPEYSQDDIRVENPKAINAKAVNKLFETSGSRGLKVLKSYDMFLDDIGSEETFVSHYGTKISPIEDLLFDRNENKSIKTFATSNLNLEKLKSVYGERMGDRWSEMFNLVIIEGNSRRA